MKQFWLKKDETRLSVLLSAIKDDKWHNRYQAAMTMCGMDLTNPLIEKSIREILANNEEIWHVRKHIVQELIKRKAKQEEPIIEEFLRISQNDTDWRIKRLANMALRREYKNVAIVSATEIQIDGVAYHPTEEDIQNYLNSVDRPIFTE